MKIKLNALKQFIAVIITLAIVSAPVAATPAFKGAGEEPRASGPLKDKDNPLMIGKRDINKRTIDFYSLEKETKLGRELAAQVITEYINRLGQNIVLHSDAKVPFTIKIIDSADVNAFALPGRVVSGSAIKEVEEQI